MTRGRVTPRAEGGPAKWFLVPATRPEKGVPTEPLRVVGRRAARRTPTSDGASRPPEADDRSDRDSSPRVDALSLRYRTDDATPDLYAPWIDELLRVLESGSRVLDIGCGNCLRLVADWLARGGLAGADCRLDRVDRVRLFWARRTT